MFALAKFTKILQNHFSVNKIHFATDKVQRENSFPPHPKYISIFLYLNFSLSVSNIITLRNNKNKSKSKKLFVPLR